MRGLSWTKPSQVNSLKRREVIATKLVCDCLANMIHVFKKKTEKNFYLPNLIFILHAISVSFFQGVSIRLRH